MADFLNLVNGLIRESGVEDEALTSSNFATAESLAPIYGKFKHFVNQAWREVQEEREGYKWQTGSALVVVRPRLRFYDATDLGGGTFTGNAISGETQVSLGLSSPIYTDSGNTEGYADIMGQPTTADTLGDDNALYAILRSGESIFFPDLDSPNSAYRFYGWGEYNFLDQAEPLDTNLTDIAEVHLTSMRILSDNSDNVEGQALPYIPWTDWTFGNDGIRNSYIPLGASPATPVSYTQNPQGKFLFSNPLDRPYRLKFQYTKRPHELVLYNDIPQGLRAEFHDYILWKALEKYGMYDNRPMVMARGQKEAMKFKRRLERLDMPTTFLNPGIQW